jgi:pimeloyl-ACP methyl ester carboxylesterase
MHKFLGEVRRLDDMLLCPPRAQYERLDNKVTQAARKLKIPTKFFETTNSFQTEKFTLFGFFTQPLIPSRNCIVYCHTRNASLEEAASLIAFAHERGLGICAFDFRHHGQSGGAFSSLGFLETLDIATILSFLLKETGFDKFVLWGRSMGSVACINFCSRHHRRTLHDKFGITLPFEEHVAFVVLDSPFFSIISCAQNLVQQYIPGVPDFVTSTFLSLFDDEINTKIGVSLEEMNMGFQSYHLKDAPYRFIFSLNDELVSLSEQNKIFERVQFWDKKIYKAPGNHSAVRDPLLLTDIFNSMAVYLHSLEMREAKKIRSLKQLN